MTWWRWLLVDRLLQPGAFADWARSNTQVNDRSVVVVAGALGFVWAGVAALYDDDVPKALLGALVYGPLLGWAVVYCVGAAWNWVLSGFRTTGNLDLVLASWAYSLAPLAWLVVLAGVLSLTTGWGLQHRAPDGMALGIAVVGGAWVTWLSVRAVSRAHGVSAWLAGATLVATVFLLAVLTLAPLYVIGAAGWWLFDS